MATNPGIVRVALIGCGSISRAHVAGALKHPGKIRYTALCDVLPERMEERSNQLGGVSLRFTDWKQMFKSAKKEFDAVDICLPHHLHGSAIMDAAAAGKHILCEKPMCTSLKQADEIAAAISKAGVIYMSAHNQLFMPAVHEAKRMIQAGEIGRVLWVRSADCFRAPMIARQNWGWRANLINQGGGELIDTGYHPTYRLLYLVDSPVVEVRSVMGRYLQEIDGEDTASVQVRFANGTIGEILTSWAFPLPYGTHQIHIIGEEGQLFGSDNILYHLPVGWSEPAKKSFPQVDTFEQEILHFAQCVRERKRPIHSVQEGRSVLEVILKATEDAKGW